MTFALITEGITDYLIIKQILINYFKEEDIIINQIQPQIDATDRQTTGGGWTEVINYCENEIIDEIILWNDFLIIQIDTDIGDEPKINLQMHNKSVEEIYEGMTSKLLSFISQNTNEIEKIIFAIGIHQIECWLVGIIDSRHDKSNVQNCLQRLNNAISKRKEYKIIPPKKKENSKETYVLLTSKLKKKKNITNISKKNYGFEKFVEQLRNIDNNR